MSKWLAAFVVVIGFGTARADSKVDWSQYLEKPGDRTPVKARPTPKVAKATPATKAAPKAKSATARPKPKATRGRRR
jgi:hypothetical protein